MRTADFRGAIKMQRARGDPLGARNPRGTWGAVNKFDGKCAASLHWDFCARGVLCVGGRRAEIWFIESLFWTTSSLSSLSPSLFILFKLRFMVVRRSGRVLRRDQLAAITTFKSLSHLLYMKSEYFNAMQSWINFKIIASLQHARLSLLNQ